MGRSKDFESEQYLKESKQRFLEKIKIEESGCWKWYGCTNQKYGVMRFKGKNESAHRFSYRNFVDQEIGNKFVCHKCDHPLCVNPDHLFLGSHEQNMKDATNKRRYAFGEKHYQNKLKEKDIEEIQILYKSGLSQSKICELFGVEQTVISGVLSGKNWKYSEREEFDAEKIIKCVKILLGESTLYKILKFYQFAKNVL